jgi:hypothetical protein
MMDMMTAPINMFDQAGIRFAYRSAAGCLLAVLALLWTATVRGEVLSDPTRPAPAWLAAQPKAPGVAAVEDSTPTLQLLLIGPSRKYAIISGQVVKLGGAYKDSKLVAVRPGEVDLQDDNSLQTLKMHPGIKKTVKRR